MPGLLRGVARTAVIAGTATTVSNRVSRRQAGRWAEQDQPHSRPSRPRPRRSTRLRRLLRLRRAMTWTTLAQLKQLGELKEQGVLTGAEFEQQKARILGS